MGNSVPLLKNLDYMTLFLVKKLIFEAGNLVFCGKKVRARSSRGKGWKELKPYCVLTVTSYIWEEGDELRDR